MSEGKSENLAYLKLAAIQAATISKMSKALFARGCFSQNPT